MKRPRVQLNSVRSHRNTHSLLNYSEFESDLTWSCDTTWQQKQNQSLHFCFTSFLKDKEERMKSNSFSSMISSFVFFECTGGFFLIRIICLQNWISSCRTKFRQTENAHNLSGDMCDPRNWGLLWKQNYCDTFMMICWVLSIYESKGGVNYILTSFSPNVFPVKVFSEVVPVSSTTGNRDNNTVK